MSCRFVCPLVNTLYQLSVHHAQQQVHGEFWLDIALGIQKIFIHLMSMFVHCFIGTVILVLTLHMYVLNIKPILAIISCYLVLILKWFNFSWFMPNCTLQTSLVPLFHNTRGSKKFCNILVVWGTIWQLWMLLLRLWKW